MSSKSKTEGGHGGHEGGHGGHDPLVQIARKGVTGGHVYRNMTPVTPSSRGREPEPEKNSSSSKSLVELLVGEPVPMSHMIRPGQVVEHNRQRYVAFSIDPYINREGREIELFKFLSACKVCGSTFSITVALSTKYWNARCPGCIRTRVEA